VFCQDYLSLLIGTFMCLMCLMCLIGILLCLPGLSYVADWHIDPASGFGTRALDDGSRYLLLDGF
jgi:hypothetical protein